MITVLSDHNCEGQARRIFHFLEQWSFVTLLNLRLLTFKQVKLPFNASDEQVWRFCQTHRFYLLTGNRTRKDKEQSLHDVLAKFSQFDSIPVITIGDVQRVDHDQPYTDACGEAIAEIFLSPELYTGVPRLFIPF